MKNLTTHRGKLSGQFHADEAAVVFFTGMSQEELFNLKYDMGKRWLEVLFKDLEFGQEYAAEWWAEAEIMQVWNLHWRNTDTRWIEPILHKVIVAERENVYRDMHLGIFDTTSDEYGWLCRAIYRAMERINKNLRKDQKGWVPAIHNNYGKAENRVN